ncbi:hypothetical protein K2173_023721 [Erythroxylum novogranatense]|uniref:Protein phosphatase 1 regulatory subunit 7 n=1 Tax=Erythroxylum novogranatense TaxID=1862640 RepID=A0AAV8TPB8_9ROSI|nr:hypothetical protein K2173_023721 [Erythroxylum novogranatense]
MSRLNTKQVLKDANTADPHSVTSLSLTYKALSDVSCLGEFKSLERLDLAGNSLTSLEGLRLCVNLKWLSLVQNKLQSLKGIEGLSKLTVLNAGKNKLKTMEELKSLVNLRALILNENEIASICGLDQMKELNTLVLSRNPVGLVGESLTKVKSITKLSMSNCQLHAIGSSLKSCIELKELRLAHNDIQTLPVELANNKKLQNLDLGNNTITRWSDLKVLKVLVDLKHLNLQGNPISEKENLAKKVLNLLPNLHVFNAKPISKSIVTKSKTIIGAVDKMDDSSLISSKEFEVSLRKTKEQTREKMASKKEMDQRKNSHLNEASEPYEENDLKQKNRTARDELPKKDEVSLPEKVDKKRKRKQPQEEQNSSVHPDLENRYNSKEESTEEYLKKGLVVKNGKLTREKKLKSKRFVEEQGGHDIIDDGNKSFADIYTFDAAERPIIGGEKEVAANISKLDSLVTRPRKKQRNENNGTDAVFLQSSPTVEIGMGGPSTWGDE